MLNTTGWDTADELVQLRAEVRRAHAEIARLRELVPANGQPSDADLVLFGYGSLMWNAGSIPFFDRRPCFVRGFRRRLWQRSTDHRGTIDAPGRVATLVSTGNDADVVYGIGLCVAPDQAAVVEEYLDHREKDAYTKRRVPLWDAQTGALISDNALVYVGFEEAYVDRSEDASFIAAEIGAAHCQSLQQRNRSHRAAQRSGPSGTNTEYALMLQTALARAGLHDDHVYAVVSHLLHIQ